MDGDIFELTNLRGSPQFLFGYLVTSAPIDIMSEASGLSTFHELRELKTMKRSNISMSVENQKAICLCIVKIILPGD